MTLIDEDAGVTLDAPVLRRGCHELQKTRPSFDVEDTDVIDVETRLSLMCLRCGSGCYV